MGLCSGHVNEWEKRTVQAVYQMTGLLLMQTGTDRKISKTAIGYLTKKKKKATFFSPHCRLFCRWPKGLNVKVAYSCLDENQEGGSPTRISCRVAAPLRLLHPREFDRRRRQCRVWRCHLLVLRTWMMLASILETRVTPGTRLHPLPKPPIRIFYPNVWALAASRCTEVAAGTTPVRTGCRHPRRWPWPQKRTPAAEAWSRIWSC